MDAKTLLHKYAYYYDYLQKLGVIELSDSPTLDDIEPSRGLVQAGYKDVKAVDFDGNLVDYLCFVSMQYLVHQVLATNKEIKDCLGVANAICQLHSSFPADLANFLRLAMKKPNIFFDLLPFKEKQREAFAVISGYWFELYLRETTGSS